jgi:crotonobetainyl-CoA:carnitine CoA-transferase CaiB-like acyl-CoA transferase
MGPLAGVRVVEVGHHLIGPLTCMYLADLGAEVIKVEPLYGEQFRTAGPPIPGGTDSRLFVAVNRNKRGIALDFGKPEGLAVLHRLIGKADVFVENFTPDIVDKLKLGYPELSAVNPRLIYCGISAFGEVGAGRDRRAFDLVVEGEAGLLMKRAGSDELPFRGPLPLTDTAGPMLLAFGVASALFGRERTGRGERISLSLLDVAIALQAHQFIWFQDGPPPSLDPVPVFLYRVYRTADDHVTLGVRSHALWLRLCRTIGLEALVDDPQYQNWEAVCRHSAELTPLVEKKFAERTTADWLARLQAAGVPCGRVRPGTDLFTDPQVAANHMLVDAEHPIGGPVKVMGLPLHFAKNPGDIRRLAPALGEHTTEVLREVGYSADEIDGLRRDRIAG